jgi:hypothetical protein
VVPGRRRKQWWDTNYFWDQRRGTVRMKSFERGHTMNNTGVSEALTEWSIGAFVVNRLKTWGRYERQGRINTRY